MRFTKDLHKGDSKKKKKDLHKGVHPGKKRDFDRFFHSGALEIALIFEILSP